MIHGSKTGDSFVKNIHPQSAKGQKPISVGSDKTNNDGYRKPSPGMVGKGQFLMVEKENSTHLPNSKRELFAEGEKRTQYLSNK